MAIYNRFFLEKFASLKTLNLLLNLLIFLKEKKKNLRRSNNLIEFAIKREGEIEKV